MLLQGMTTPTQCQCQPRAEGTHNSDFSLCAQGKFQAGAELATNLGSGGLGSTDLGHVAVTEECQLCPANSYQPTSGSTSCFACPGNLSAAAGSDCIDDCYCDTGFFSN